LYSYWSSNMFFSMSLISELTIRSVLSEALRLSSWLLLLMIGNFGNG
jgi:hypothetical protein